MTALRALILIPLLPVLFLTAICDILSDVTGFPLTESLIDAVLKQ